MFYISDRRFGPCDYKKYIITFIMCVYEIYFLTPWPSDIEFVWNSLERDLYLIMFVLRWVNKTKTIKSNSHLEYTSFGGVFAFSIFF